MVNFQDNSVYRCHQFKMHEDNIDKGAAERPINRLI